MCRSPSRVHLDPVDRRLRWRRRASRSRPAGPGVPGRQPPKDLEQVDLRPARLRVLAVLPVDHQDVHRRPERTRAHAVEHAVDERRRLGRRRTSAPAARPRRSPPWAETRRCEARGWPSRRMLRSTTPIRSSRQFSAARAASAVELPTSGARAVRQRFGAVEDPGLGPVSRDQAARDPAGYRRRPELRRRRAAGGRGPGPWSQVGASAPPAAGEDVGGSEARPPPPRTPCCPRRRRPGPAPAPWCRR